jgi:hypothetical protein
MERTESESLDRQLDSYGTMARRREAGSVADGSDSARSWKRFAAATGVSLVGVTAADAAITHVVPNPPIRVDAFSNDYTQIDLDGVGGFDLAVGIGGSFDYAYNGTRLYGFADGLGNVSMFGGVDVYPLGDLGLQRFGSNDPIPPTSPATPGSILRVSTTGAGGTFFTNGPWAVDDTGIAGFVMGPSGSKQAGWIKIRTESFFDGSFDRLGAIEILEWAFQSVPGVGIMAGQIASGDPIPGDYDGNGSVGPEDYTEWKSAFNSNVTPGTGADGNSDGTVNAADYTVWRDNLGASGSGALAANVPEPTTVSLGVLALGAAGIAALRRRAS